MLLSGGSGSTYFYTDATHPTAIRIPGQNNDTVLLRVDGAAGSTDDGQFGFSLAYTGDDTGNNNALEIRADAQTAASQVVGMRMLQDGQTAFPQGITLGSSSTNLSDYEEGTWTPTYQTAGTGFTSVTYDSPAGRYTKIGNVVHIQAFISTDSISKGSASGAIQIGGLPFTAIANNGIDGFAALAISTAQDFAGNQPDVLQVTANQTYGELRYRSTSNGPLLAMQVSDMGTGLNDNVCYITGTYLSA